MALQVVALNVRSRAKRSQPPLPPAEEQDYPQSLNKSLPSDIRVLGWSDIDPSFDARCTALYINSPETIVGHKERSTH